MGKTGNFKIVALAALALAVLCPGQVQAAPPWHSPVNVSGVGREVDSPGIAIADSGEAIAVWTRVRKKRSVVQSASRLPGGDWSAPRTISSLRSFEPKIAVDATGGAVAVWSHLDGRKRVIQGASRSAEGVWSAPVTISKGRGRPSFYEVAINDAGEAVAAWVTSFDDGTSVMQTAVRPLFGPWSKPTNAFPRVENLDSGYPEVAITAAGEVVAVWGRLDPRFTPKLESASRPVGGTWSRPVLLENLTESYGVPPDPEIAFNAGGEVVALWEREEDNFQMSIQSASRPPAGAWSPPISIFKGQAEKEGVYPQIAINDAGEAIAVWEGFDDRPVEIRSASRSPGGAWSRPTRLFRGHDPPLDLPIVTAGEASPLIAINASGAAVSVWQRSDGIRSAFRSPAGAWSRPVAVAKAGEGFDADVAISSAGEVVATWQHFDGEHEVVRSASTNGT